MRGKAVLVTGASSGIGAGIAVHFASKGCLVSLTGRSEQGLQDTLNACVLAGAKADDILLIPADLQKLENLRMIVEQTFSKFGKLDVLVNNAGCAIMSDMSKVSYEDYDTVMDTNLKAVFFLTQAALPHLIQSKGNVVNVSSVFSHVPFKLCMVYSMSKAALDHFTRTLAVDVASHNVRVNAVNPGSVNTQILERSSFPYSFEEFGKIFHAMRRGGTVEEVAKSVAFLADNEQSSFTTGVTLLVDGGARLMGPL